MTPGITSKARKSRRDRWCDEDFAHDRRINAGEFYVRTVMFPSHDISTHLVPVAMDLCAACAEGYEGTRGLIAARSAERAA